MTLKYASNKLKNNKKIVLIAVKQYGGSLQYASEELKNDKEVVLVAVTKNGEALHFTSEELKNDKEVVLAAVKQDGPSLKHASTKLQNDLDLLKLLQRYHIDNNINDYSEEYKKWYKQRMNVLDILNEQKLLEENIPNNPVKPKTRKF